MAAKKLNACYSEDHRTFPPKAQRTCARVKNCMRVSFVDFLPGLCLLNRALFSTCISINISPELVMRKFCILFYPLLGGGGCTEQNGMCHLPTSGGKAAANWTCLAALSRLLPHPVLPQAAELRCVGCAVGSWTSARHLILFQARGIMFWEEAMEKSLVSQHLEDTAGEIN